MRAHLRGLLNALGDTFFLVPALLVLVGVAGAFGLVTLDRSGIVPDRVLASPYIYSGGGTGARTLLGAVASSTIGVAGTVFSITIAALSLAAGQMGPRLLRNFTRDRGNQITLGIFLGTFAYALLVLRTVRTHGEGDFVPHLALSVAILLALLCVGTLVFFVGHTAGRINVETVVDLVSDDVQRAIRRLATAEPSPAPPGKALWAGAARVVDPRQGYFQELDETALADWAVGAGATLRLLVRPGDFVFPGAPVALVVGAEPDEAATAFQKGSAVGRQRVSSTDLEFAVRQLVEVGVRALSPGINDPHTAISVVEHLGAALCHLAPLHLPGGVTLRNGRPVLVVPRVAYDGLLDSMFHMIRQNGEGSPAVLIRLLEVLSAVATCDTAPGRVAALRRHAGLVIADGRRSIANPNDLADLEARFAAFGRVDA